MGSLDALVQSIKSDPIESTGDIYHPIPFAEFKLLKPAVDEKVVYQKYRLIRSALPIDNFKGVKILDVGANAGFFSYKFAQLGASVDAIEPSGRYYEIGKVVASHFDLNVTWFHQSVGIDFLQGKNYDIALMLSVFQWISQGNRKLDSAKSILSEISLRADYLFFELGCNWGKSAIETNTSGLPWIVQLLHECTPYSQIGYLGTTRLWGGRWAGWRYNRFLFCCTNGSAKLNSWQKIVTRVVKPH
jgi:SAM-dependent methyltransferase